MFLPFQTALPFAKVPRGFTLAELLVSLLILGEIATFSIPKILTAQQNAQKNAVFKELIATAQQAIYTSLQQGDFKIGNHACMTNSTVQVYTMLLGDFNYSKAVPVDAYSGTFYFHNGGSIMVYRGHLLDFHFDWNGDAPPNTAGDDKLILYYNDCSATQYSIPSNRFDTNDAAQKAYYESLFR